MSLRPVLVTGASGFLGRHVLGALSAGGIPACALVRSAESWRAMDWTAQLKGVTTVIGDLDRPEEWTGEIPAGGFGTVMHLAALVRHSRSHPEEVYRTNVDATLGLVRVAATHRARMIFSSTAGTVACSPTPDRWADEDAPYCEAEVARWPYYHSKILAERQARKLAGELGVELVIVRPPVLLGPGDHRFRSTGHLIRYLRGRLPFLVRGGMHFADVRDAANALAALVLLPSPRPVYHFTGLASTVAQFFALAGETAGVSRRLRVIPYQVAWPLAALLRPLHLLPDPVLIENAAHYWRTTSRFAELDLGYRSRPGVETLRDTIEWLRENHPDLKSRQPPAASRRSQLSI